MDRNETQLNSSRTAYERALELRKVFVRELERKSHDAMQAIRDHRRAQWQAKVSDALESFRVGGIDQTHDEMLRKIEERTAVNEARMHLALESMDREAMQIDVQDAGVHLMLARALLNTDERKESIKEFQTAIQLDPQNADARFELAKTHLAAKDSVQARKVLEELLKLQADHQDAKRLLEELP